MSEKERNTYLICNEEDILNRYPGLFTQYYLQNDPTYCLENANPKREGFFRFIIFPAGVVAISSVGTNSIWDVQNWDEKGESVFKYDLFQKIDSVVEEVNESKTTNVKDLVKEISYDCNQYFLRIFPYSDKHSSDVITSILDQRYEDIQNQSSLL